MEIHELTRDWLRYYNKNYPNYFGGHREPRYETKQFFLYSYYLLKSFGSQWESYLRKYIDVFLGEPSRDWYGKRDITDEDSRQARRNIIEWITTLSSTALVGYPTLKSARDLLIKNAQANLARAALNPDKEFSDLLISSAIINLPAIRGKYADLFKELVVNHLKTPEEHSIHSWVACYNALEHLPETEELRVGVYKEITRWINNPSGSARPNILGVARVVNSLNWTAVESDTRVIMSRLKDLLLDYLRQLHRFEWHNSPFILQAVYNVSSGTARKEIQDIISRGICPSRFLVLRDVFPFLSEELRLRTLDVEVEKIREKCRPHPTKELCKKCMTRRQGHCWMRILAKILDVAPGFHDPFEVADQVMYTLEQGIYFVVKADEITRQRGEGDVLHRQCTTLFNSNHALVFYLNPKSTAPAVLERIRHAASSSMNDPKFFVIDRKYINQIYSWYKTHHVPAESPQATRPPSNT